MYIVSANTYSGSYGLELTLFGIFNSKEEAVKWIIDHPKHKQKDMYGDEEEFDFFKYFERYMELGIANTKEEFIEKCKFITEFAGEPVCLDSYIE